MLRRDGDGALSDLDPLAYGDPCNGCGKCCQIELCPIGEALFGRTEGPCPALEYDHGRYWCGCIRNPRKYAPVKTAIHGAAKMREAAVFFVGADIGCDAFREGDIPPDRLAVYKAHSASIGDALKLVFMKCWGLNNGNSAT